MGKEKVCPEVFWSSDPVQPGETVMVSGWEFDESVSAEVCRLPDGPPGNPSGGKDGKTAAQEMEWEKTVCFQHSPDSVKFAVPADSEPGVFCYRLRVKGSRTEEVFLNMPDCWWMQGDAGEKASAGGWLRVLGKCLSFQGSGSVCFERAGAGGSVEFLKPSRSDCYNLECVIPQDFNPGIYNVWLHNGWGGNAGWVPAGTMEIKQKEKAKKKVFNVVDSGARPNEQEDSTEGILRALHLAEAAGGGVVYFPRGRYRIDCPKRLLYSIPEPIKVPRGVVLRGEGMGLVSLVWPEREDPLPALIMGGDDFAVEELTIYTQGRHNTVIEGNNGVRIHKVRIRTNCYYRVGTSEPMYKPADYYEHQRMGDAVRLSGKGFEITDCDIYHSSSGIRLELCEYGLIARNTIYYSRNYFYAHGCRKIIFEDNECFSNTLFAHSSTWAVSWKYSVANLYFARNHSRHNYGGDRENMTTDDHGTAYLGGVEKASGTKLILQEEPVWGFQHKDMVNVWHNTVIYILSGKGAGQHREVKGCEGREIEVDMPWKVAPDEQSTVSIGVYNGRSLFIGNRVEDSGSVIQLYPPNSECIVAENVNLRGGNINCGGQLSKSSFGDALRVEPSWYNQFLDNVVLEGNGWGLGGPACTAVVNGALGGEGVLNIYGTNTFREKPAISRWHVVRRHVSENNSSIRIGGNVCDIAIEGCRIKNNEHGIRLENTGEPAGPEARRAEGKVPGPENILLRNNEFEKVLSPCGGEAAGGETVKSI